MSQLVKDEDIMEQDNSRGPGWFLLIAYAVISAFCIYYAVTYWDWKSSYDEQQSEIQSQLQAK
jgi:hypothetical protein